MLAPNALLQNRYLIKGLIGKGGMGAVYLATDQRLRSTVALKETLFEDESLRKAFEREARLLASLRHAALPVVMDYFAEDNKEFLVMQFIPGDDLAEMMKRTGEAFSPDEVLRWADQLLDALDYLHTQKPPIIHRDIKPQNLKLTAQDKIILLDFGLAKGTAGQMSQVTSGGSLLGYTPNYAPLEQIQGTGTDARSDLFSLAATIYHLMTGKTPPDVLSRATAIFNGEPDPLSLPNEVNSQIPASVAEILVQAMAIKRNQRPTTAAEMRRMLSNRRQSPTLIDSSTTEAIGEHSSTPASSSITTTQVQRSTDPQTSETPASTELSTLSSPRQQTGEKRLRVSWISLVIAASILMIIMIPIGWWRYKEKHDTEQSPSSSATPLPADKIPFKVAYPVVNGQWTYPGWDPKRFNERPSEEQEELENSVKIFTTQNQTEQGARSGQWHALHMVVKFSRPSEVRVKINEDGRLSCSTCHQSFSKTIDRIYPRTTCGKCHIME